MDDSTKRLIQRALSQYPNSDATRLAASLKESGLNITKTEINAALYEMATSGLVRRITNAQGKKPVWVAQVSEPTSHPELDQFYRRAMANPREEIQLARILCELFEAIDHPKAPILRKMVDALDKKPE